LEANADSGADGLVAQIVEVEVRASLMLLVIADSPTDYAAVLPPSTDIMAPVMKEESSEARNNLPRTVAPLRGKTGRYQFRARLRWM
jgi:hypothetical protein